MICRGAANVLQGKAIVTTGWPNRKIPFRKNSVSHRCWLKLSALLILLALSSGYAGIAKAQSFDYRLGPGDKIRVEVFGRSDLSGIYTIRDSGSLSLPIAGEINALNLTLKQLETEIENQYSALMKSESGPDQAINVNIEISEYRPFYIMGDVKRPGSYEYQPRLSVLRAIAIAGGYVSSGPNANKVSGSDSAEEKEKARIRITRETDRGMVSFVADDNAIVLPGDIISVPYRAEGALPVLPEHRQQARPVEAVSSKSEGVSETDSGANSDSKTVP